jgi:hypothetical protein
MIYDNMVDVRIFINNCSDSDLWTIWGRHIIFDMTNCISEVLYDFCFSHTELHQYGDGKFWNASYLKPVFIEIVYRLVCYVIFNE